MWGINIHLKSLEATLANLKISFFLCFWTVLNYMKTIWILNIWKQKFDACHFIFFRFDTNRQNYEPRTHIKQGIYRMYFIVNNVIFTLHLFLRYEYILQPLFQFLLIHLLPLNNALHIWSGKLKLHVFLWTKKKNNKSIHKIRCNSLCSSFKI